MALQVCERCTTKFSVGALACPHCGSTDWHEEGSVMPKITVLGGASNAGDESGAQVVGGAWSSNNEPDEWPDTAEAPEVVEEASDEPREFVEVPLGETAELVSEEGEEIPVEVVEEPPAPKRTSTRKAKPKAGSDG